MTEQKPALLLVDDEENMLKMLKRVFRSEDYGVFTAESAEKGLEILAQNEIGVVFSDCKMPGMNGEKFLAVVREKYPNVYRIMHSAATYTPPKDLVSNGLVEKFIEKPALNEVISDAVRTGMDLYHSRKEE